MIGGIFALAAAFVGGAFKGQSVGLGPSPTVTVTKTNLITPGQSSSTQPGGESWTFPAQAGYISRWQEPITIGVNGVVFQQTGPVAAGNSNQDIEYFGNPGNGWDGNSNDTFSVWLSSGIPSPKDCVSKGSGYSAMETIAKQEIVIVLSIISLRMDP